MSYSGWYGYCPKCGCNKGNYKAERFNGLPFTSGYETVIYICLECGWEGKFNELLTEKEYINFKRTSLIDKMLK